METGDDGFTLLHANRGAGACQAVGGVRLFLSDGATVAALGTPESSERELPRFSAPLCEERWERNDVRRDPPLLMSVSGGANRWPGSMPGV